jgi:N-acyl-phosphatidylethanolamine-hydrolysing phospholipase D
MRALQCPAYGYLSTNRNPTRADMLAAFPVHSPDYAGFEQAAKSARVAAIWAGHASVLVSIGGVNFLTDPVFAERASPVQWAGGPPRAVPPPVRIDDPSLRVDAVLISHSHYDHMCAPTVAALHARFGARLRWYVPLGLGAWLRRRGITNVTELDWWQSAAHSSSGGANGSSGSGSTTNTVTVTLTPAQHWSARGVFDRRKTLWGGFALSTNGGGGGDNGGGGARFFFAGDSGYAPLFKEIGARLGPFDLAALPTGAYAPRGFMAPQHVDPKEAVRVHKDVGARRSVAIHCCTFHLTLGEFFMEGGGGGWGGYNATTPNTTRPLAKH